MENNIIGIIIIAAGVAVILFRHKFVHDIVEFQNRTFNFRFGQRTVNLHTILAIPFGVFFIIIGILILLGVFNNPN